MTDEKRAAIQEAIEAERLRGLAQAAGHDTGIEPAPAAAVAIAPELLTIPEAIETLAAIGQELIDQRQRLERKLDELLKSVESLRGSAIPSEQLIALGIRLDEEEAAAAASRAAGGDPAADLPAADPPPESD